MKKILPYLICLAPILSFGQCYLEPNGVTTDPRNNFDNAVNPMHPQFQNRFFDWTQHNFTGINWAPSTAGATTLNHPHSLPDDGTAIISSPT